MSKQKKTAESEELKNEEIKTHSRKKKKKKKHIFLKIVLILLAIIAIVAGIIVGYGYSKLSMLNYDEIDKNEIEVNEGVETATGYRNILLLGVDSRQNDYSNALSDSIMVVSLNQDEKKVKIASLYRESYLKIGTSLDKLTHAYAKGGAKLSLSTINTNLDLDLTEYVAINFNVVVDVVNAVGGITMEITSQEAKYINAYIDEVNRVTKHNSSHITKAGTYKLDGVQALAYARIRYTDGGDYKRTERQRDVLNLVFAKVKKMNLIELNNIADMVLKEISTNISGSDIIGLLSQVASYEIEETTGWPYDVKGYQPNGVWYGAPVNLEKQVVQLHEFLFGEEDYQVSSNVKAISDEIIKKTGYK